MVWWYIPFRETHCLTTVSYTHLDVYKRQVQTIASSRELNYTDLPEIPTEIPNTLSYLHYTTNNTIYGTQFSNIPQSAVPLFADMMSDIFSEKRDYSDYYLFYAVAKKNLGAAGVTLVVVKKHLLGKIVRKLPPILDHQQQALQHSVLNTPPVFGIYVSLLVLCWIKEKGIATLEKENRTKATLLYNEIERNTLLKGIVADSSRSKMNVVFRASTSETEKELIAFCKENGIEGISGHRSVGAVSYTHLDVYKRQSPRLAASKPSRLNASAPEPLPVWINSSARKDSSLKPSVSASMPMRF